MNQDSKEFRQLLTKTSVDTIMAEARVGRELTGRFLTKEQRATLRADGHGDVLGVVLKTTDTSVQCELYRTSNGEKLPNGQTRGLGIDYINWFTAQTFLETFQVVFETA
jgi:hypothetical protein